MNVTNRGQAVTEVDWDQDSISTATEDVFIHSGQFGSSFKHFSGLFYLSTSSFSVLLFFCTLNLNFMDISFQESFHLLVHINIPALQTRLCA